MKKLFQPIDIASIVFCRIAFGLLMFFEIANDWLAGTFRKGYIEPDFHFTYYGFEWVQPLPDLGMYLFLIIMLILPICISIGLFYRITTLLFALGYTYLFLIEKVYYLNHSYLICLLCFWMALIPAHRHYSVDARKNPQIDSNSVPYYYLFILQFHIAIVYFFGGIAKFNPDWLLYAQPLKIWLNAKQHYFLIGPIISKEIFAWFMAYGGFLFDSFIVFFLIFRKTRLIAFLAVLCFHFINTLIFSIGVFPSLSIVMTSLYFSPSWPRKFVHYWQTRKDKTVAPFSNIQPNYKAEPPAKSKAIVAFAIIYCIIHLLLPLRHHLYDGNVNWTEEGHRFSWRMMLRSKSAKLYYFVVDMDTGEKWKVRPKEYLTKRQVRKLKTHPYMIVQFAHHLKEIYQTEKGVQNLEVRAMAQAGLNSRSKQTFIDPLIDLTQITPSPFKKANWIVPLKTEQLPK